MADGITKLVSITIPSDWWAAAAELAAARGVNKSELIRDLLWTEFTAKQRKTLSQPTPRGRTARTES